MSWNTSRAGSAYQVSVAVTKDLAVQSFDDAGHGALKAAIASVAAAVAGVNPDLCVSFESGGHADRNSVYGTVTFKTHSPLP